MVKFPGGSTSPPGWFRIEIAEDVAELRRATKLTADEPVGSC